MLPDVHNDVWKIPETDREIVHPKEALGVPQTYTVGAYKCAKCKCDLKAEDSVQIERARYCFDHAIDYYKFKIQELEKKNNFKNAYQLETTLKEAHKKNKEPVRRIKLKER